ncbi:hypothetical protein SAMN05216487_3309 [Pseudomonas sp. UC 17F4]|nr:hypothetical protein SAMN05216487_3309 [Pseudomonas sp. UC 17F4]
MQSCMGVSGCQCVDFIGRNPPSPPTQTYPLVSKLVSASLPPSASCRPITVPLTLQLVIFLTFPLHTPEMSTTVYCSLGSKEKVSGMKGKHIAFWALMVIGPSALAGSISAPADPDAKYSIISVQNAGLGIEVITKREGIIGASYTKRQFDCTNRKSLYMGSSNSLADLENIRADRDALPWAKGSLTRSISEVVCKGVVLVSRPS